MLERFSRDGVPTDRELEFPTLLAIAALGGEPSTDETHDKVVDLIDLSPYVVKYRNRGAKTTLLSNRLKAARSNLKKKGLIHNPGRRRWALASRGRQELRDRIPEKEDLEIPTLMAIGELGGHNVHFSAIDQQVVKDLELPDYITRFKNNLKARDPKPLLKSRLNGARGLLKEKGLIIQSGRRGRWSLIAQGKLGIKRLNAENDFGRGAWSLSLNAEVQRTTRIIPEARRLIMEEEKIEEGSATVRRVIRRVIIER